MFTAQAFLGDILCSKLRISEAAFSEHSSIPFCSAACLTWDLYDVYLPATTFPCLLTAAKTISRLLRISFPGCSGMCQGLFDEGILTYFVFLYTAVIVSHIMSICSLQCKMSVKLHLDCLLHLLIFLRARAFKHIIS